MQSKFHPANTDTLFGVAASVTCAPTGNSAWHTVGQSIPAGVLAVVPAPPPSDPWKTLKVTRDVGGGVGEGVDVGVDAGVGAARGCGVDVGSGVGVAVGDGVGVGAPRRSWPSKTMSAVSRIPADWSSFHTLIRHADVSDQSHSLPGPNVYCTLTATENDPNCRSLGMPNCHKNTGNFGPVSTLLHDNLGSRRQAHAGDHDWDWPNVAQTCIWRGNRVDARPVGRRSRQSLVRTRAMMAAFASSRQRIAEDFTPDLQNCG